jgi:hypothetical protein
VFITKEITLPLLFSLPLELMLLPMWFSDTSLFIDNLKNHEKTKFFDLIKK